MTNQEAAGQTPNLSNDALLKVPAGTVRVVMIDLAARLDEVKDTPLETLREWWRTGKSPKATSRVEFRDAAGRVLPPV